MNFKTPTLNSQKNLLVNFSLFSSITIISILLFKFIIPFLMPFLVGFLIATVLNPIASFMHEKTNLNNKLCKILIILAAYLPLTLIALLLGMHTINNIKSFFNSESEFLKNTILPTLENLQQTIKNKLSTIIPNFFDNTENILSNLNQKLIETLYSKLNSIFDFTAQIGTKIPNFLTNLIFSVLSSIYFCCDYEKICAFVFKMLPKKVKKFVNETKNYALKITKNYLKAYLILMIITFAMLSLGFIVIGIKNPILKALVITIFDAIPMVGVGIVLIPWCIFALILGNTKQFLGLAILCIIIGVVKRILEPKIFGDNLGLSPITTLISIYLGMKFFGIFGMILLPITTKIVYSIAKSDKQKA